MEESTETRTSSDHSSPDVAQEGRMMEEQVTEKEIREALASLHLPHMPPTESELPTITVLVCADIDLTSTAALAEYSLMQKNEMFDANSIDLIIAAGPCARDDNLLPYYGSSRRRRQSSLRNVLVRTQEETAALRGLVTAALSQLESLVCRVVYCPGLNDPSFTSQQRLTPNSRNIHRQFLPLAPGLGCAGLLYIDTTENRTRAFPHFSSSANTNNNNDDDEGHSSTTKRDTESETCSTSDYIFTLFRLLALAPTKRNNASPINSVGQAVLVTHYVDATQQLSNEKQPWPSQHDDFVESAGEALCLEIASGAAQHHEPSWKNPVLLPGSLRERGEFSILKLSLVEKKYNQRRFAWQVRNVDFHRLNQFRK